MIARNLFVLLLDRRGRFDPFLIRANLLLDMRLILLCGSDVLLDGAKLGPELLKLGRVRMIYGTRFRGRSPSGGVSDLLLQIGDLALNGNYVGIVGRIGCLQRLLL